MTQSLPNEFPSLNSLLAWARQDKPNFYPVHRKTNIPPVVYVMKEGTYYYFRISKDDKYILIASCDRDVFAESGDVQ